MEHVQRRSRLFRQPLVKRMIKVALFLSLLTLMTLLLQFSFVDKGTISSEHETYKNCDIIFLELTDRKIIEPRHACSIESAAFHHPNNTICLGLKNNLEILKSNMEQFSNLKNVLILPLNLDVLFEWTPLYPWWTEEFKFATSPWRTIHLSDAARLAFLYKYGGMYLDLDMMLVRPTFDLDVNFVAIQYYSNDDGVGTAVLKFQRMHPFLTKWLYAIPGKYDEGDRATIGSNLLTQLLMPYCQLDVPDVKKTLHEIAGKYCDYQLKVFAPDTFYPIPWTSWKTIFNTASDNSISIRLLNNTNTHGFHYWNELSQKSRIPGDVAEPFTAIAQLFCPNIYWNLIASTEWQKKERLKAKQLKMILKWSNNGKVNLAARNT
jgi:lactosylceramide 4-alpha-galactosyltransferase